MAAGVPMKAMVAAIALVAALPGAAGAQASVGMLPAIARGRQEARLTERVREVARTALEARGFRVADDAEVARVTAESCPEQGPECLGEVLDRLGLDALCQTVVWPASREREAEIVIAIVSARATGGGSMRVLGDALEPAAEQALSAALADLDEQAIDVEVQGTPEGAALVIDGQPAGQLPWRGALRPGEHALVASAAGYEERRETIDVRLGSARFELTLVPSPDLERTPALQPGSGTPARSDGWPSVLLGASAVALGGALAVPVIWTAAEHGRCASECRAHVELDGRAAALGVVAGIVMVGGIVIAVTQPITVSVGGSSTGARIELGGRF